jgi:hypothetical protein
MLCFSLFVSSTDFIFILIIWNFPVVHFREFLIEHFGLTTRHLGSQSVTDEYYVKLISKVSQEGWKMSRQPHYSPDLTPT